MVKTRTIFLINAFIFLAVVLICLFFGFIFVKGNISSAEVVEDKAPPKISNIEISSVGATSSVITWKTDELSDSLINYGLDKNYGILRQPNFDKKLHQLILEDLMPDTLYYFRITSSDPYGNQGISSDYSFNTQEIPEIKEKLPEIKPEDQTTEEQIEQFKKVEQQEITSEPDQNIQNVMETIDEINSEEVLKAVQERVQKRAEDILAPPTIILNYADVEVGTDYAIISWKTDKESDSMVALAAENSYNPDAADPYKWKEGEPGKLTLDHVVEITGLSPSTIYHFQVLSKSAFDLTGRSEDRTFKTKSVVPEIFNVRVSKVQEDSATINWSTNIPTSAIVEYTNLNNNQAKLEGRSSYLAVHSIQLSNLVFDNYYSAVIRVESEDGEKSESDPITFITTRDKVPPSVSKVSTESTLYPGSENKIQTIASWETDEPSMCQMFYHQGLISVDEPQSLAKENEYRTKHVEVITNFVPSAVYKFWIICADEAENKAQSDDFTMLTPSQEESIIDIIIKNFESSFGWLKKAK